ncbi:TrmH family RNA methyltransferase, partial [Lactococcus lactis]
IMGNEGAGVSDEAVKAADKLVHIDMPGQAESLNVAVAAGILMFSL